MKKLTLVAALLMFLAAGAMANTGGTVPTSVSNVRLENPKVTERKKDEKHIRKDVKELRKDKAAYRGNVKAGHRKMANGKRRDIKHERKHLHKGVKKAHHHGVKHPVRKAEHHK